MESPAQPLKGGQHEGILKSLPARPVAAALFARSASAQHVKIALVVKALGNGFFEAANKGAEEAAAGARQRRDHLHRPDRHHRRGPDRGDQRADRPAASMRSRSPRTTPTRWSRRSRRRCRRGITVISWDSASRPRAGEMHLNPSSNELIGNMIIKLAADHLPEGGDVAVLSASATATNQNTWIEEMNKVKGNYPGINVVATVYGDDLSDKSYREAQGLIESYPNLKAIIAPTSVGIVAAAQAVTDAGKIGQINVTGLGLPSEMAGARRVRRVEVLRDLEPDRPRLLGDDDRLQPRHRQGDGRSPARDPDGPDGRGQARRHQRGRHGRPLRLRQVEHRASSSRSSEIERLPAPRPPGRGPQPNRRDGTRHALSPRARPPAEHPPRAPDDPDALALDGISKSFPGVKALDGVGLRLYPGRSPRSSARTAPASRRSSRSSPASTSPTPARSARRPAGRLPDARRASAAGVTAIHQETVLFDELSVAENIFLGHAPRTRLGLIDWAAMRRAPRAMLARLDADIDPAVRLRDLGIANGTWSPSPGPCRSTPASSSWTSRPPRCPTRRSTSSTRIIERLKAEGKAILFISHKFDEIFRIADRYTVFRDGQLVGEGRSPDVDQDRARAR